MKVLCSFLLITSIYAGPPSEETHGTPSLVVDGGIETDGIGLIGVSAADIYTKTKEGALKMPACDQETIDSNEWYFDGKHDGFSNNGIIKPEEIATKSCGYWEPGIVKEVQLCRNRLIIIDENIPQEQAGVVEKEAKGKPKSGFIERVIVQTRALQTMEGGSIYQTCNDSGKGRMGYWEGNGGYKNYRVPYTELKKLLKKTWCMEYKNGDENKWANDCLDNLDNKVVPLCEYFCYSPKYVHNAWSCEPTEDGKGETCNYTAEGNIVELFSTPHQKMDRHYGVGEKLGNYINSFDGQKGYVCRCEKR